MAPGEDLPSELGAPPEWSRGADRLEDMLAATGFVSSDLAVAQHPTLAMSGAMSHPRFTELAQRLVDVMPHASSFTSPGSSHLSPPHRVVAPERLQQQLSRLWGR